MIKEALGIAPLSCLISFIAVKSGAIVGPEPLAYWAESKRENSKIYWQGQFYILSYFVKLDRLTQQLETLRVKRRVSKEKIRFTENGFDLDLTCILSRKF